MNSQFEIKQAPDYIIGPFQFAYALEKFTAAVNSLAVGAGDVRSRLLGIFDGPLYMIDQQKLPVKLHSRWEFVEKEISKFDEYWPNQRADWEKLHNNVPFEAPPRIDATLRRITNREGSEIAENIFSIWFELDCMSRDLERVA